MTTGEPQLGPALYDSLRALMVKVDDYTPMTSTREDGAIIRRAVSVPTNEKLDVMHQLNPESIGLMVKLLSTGSVTGQKLAYSSYRNRFSSILDDKNEHRHWVKLGEDSNKISYDDYATMSWNFGNVSESVGASDGFTYQAYFFTLIDTYAAYAKCGATDSYWSGVAALAYAEPLEATFDVSDEARHDFIEWAGKRQDIGTVIMLARERETILVSTLDPVLKDQDRVSPSLAEGVL